MCREVRETETPLFTGSEPEDRLAVGVNLIALSTCPRAASITFTMLFRSSSHSTPYSPQPQGHGMITTMIVTEAR